MNTKNKLLRVSVGIACFNEQKNIAQVLQSILNQTRSGWELAEILVYNDGSSDRTAEEVSSVKNNLIKLIDDKKRRGKTYRLSQMFQAETGEILVMFDGDISFADKNVITNMLKPFEDPQVMLAGGNSTPRKPENFFQRSVYSTFSVFYKSRKYIKNGNNIFGCTGSILGIRNTLAKQIKIPSIINEDAYIYLYCIQNNGKFMYQDDAKIYYTLPDNLTDYLRQAFRSHPEAVTIELKKYFGGLVDREFHRPLKFYLLSVFQIFLKQPLEVIYISIINLLCKPLYAIVSSRYKLNWFTAKSTH